MNYLARIRKEKEQRAADAAIDCSLDEDMVRPEWAKDADINTIVQRIMNGQQVPTRQAVYGEMDYTLDLQGLLKARETLLDTYHGLPAETRAAVTLEAFLDGIRTGDLEAVQDAVQKAKKPPVQPASDNGSGNNAEPEKTP